MTYRRIGLETEGVDAKMQKEIEIGFWVRINDWDEVKELIGKAEKQEQISVYIDKSDLNYVAGAIRIRRTEDKDGNLTYLMTIKQKFRGEVDSGSSLNTEVEFEVSEDAYLSMAGFCSGVVKKHRYSIPIDGTDLYWALDCAEDGEGGYKPWVRVELEVPELNAPLPNLPFATEEEIVPEQFGGNYNSEQFRELNDKLFNELFYHDGPLVKRKEETEEEDEG